MFQLPAEGAEGIIYLSPGAELKPPGDLGEIPSPSRVIGLRMSESKQPICLRIRGPTVPSVASERRGSAVAARLPEEPQQGELASHWLLSDCG